MELKVGMNGAVRTLSGVTNNTTCAQIIYTLAHATGQKGRFVLIQNILDKERSLAHWEKPLEIMERWGDSFSYFVSYYVKLLDDSTEDENACSVTDDAYPVDANIRVEGTEISGSPESNTQTTVGSIQPTVDAGNNQETSSTEHSHPPESPKTVKHQAPPDFHDSIVQRISALVSKMSPSAIRASFPSGTGSNDDSAEDRSEATARDCKNMSTDALNDLVETQKQIIELQKAYLTRLDEESPDDQLRIAFQLLALESIQLYCIINHKQSTLLERQQEKLRKRDWSSHLEYERAELRKINDGIIAIKQKLDEIAEETKKRTSEEKRLWEQINKAENDLKMMEEEEEEEEEEEDEAEGLPNDDYY